MSDTPKKEQAWRTLEGETARAEQLWHNCKWLIDKFDHMHTILGLKQVGGWTKRVEQVTEAVEAMASKTAEPPSCPNCGGSVKGDGFTVVQHGENAEDIHHVEPDTQSHLRAAGRVVLISQEDDQLVLHKDGEWVASLEAPRDIVLRFWSTFGGLDLPDVSAWESRLEAFIRDFPLSDEAEGY